jgi:hypothetical protein
LIFGIASDLLRSQVALEAEILVLRQQIDVLPAALWLADYGAWPAATAVVRNYCASNGRMDRRRAQEAKKPRCCAAAAWPPAAELLLVRMRAKGRRPLRKMRAEKVDC